MTQRVFECPKVHTGVRTQNCSMTRALFLQPCLHATVNRSCADISAAVCCAVEFCNNDQAETGSGRLSSRKNTSTYEILSLFMVLLTICCPCT